MTKCKKMINHINYLNISTLLISRKIRQVGIFIPLFLLSSCAIYSTGFNCADSRGAPCVMLSEIDRRVDSGEIETVYLDKKCKGRACNKEISNVPKKAFNQIHKVKIIPIDDQLNEYQDGDDLYLK